MVGRRGAMVQSATSLFPLNSITNHWFNQIGNGGFRVGRRSKLTSISSYRKGYVDGFMKKVSSKNQPLSFFIDDINGVPARPFGTVFEGSSFAYKHKNTLFISVDAFRLVNGGKEDYIDRKRGFGGEGYVPHQVEKIENSFLHLTLLSIN